MDDIKDVKEMTPEELAEELITPKKPKKYRRQSQQEKKRSRSYLERYLKAFSSLYK